MAQEYLMNIASVLFFICYIPEFYANYRNKNANIYNVFEKIILVGGTGLGLGYALVINYATLFSLDIVALSMRGYYAYNNYGRDVRVINIDESIDECINNGHIDRTIDRTIDKINEMNEIYNPIQDL